jgi:autotransporter strand-loop-strand O-heptosyltransferase
LVTNRFVSESNIEALKDLYFDHDLCVNEFSEDVDYFFLNSDSFTDVQLKEIASKFENIRGSFEVNIYSLLEGNEDEHFEKIKTRILDIFNKPTSWNHFCRNLAFNVQYKNIKKKVLIELCSSSLGDSVAWTPYAEQYRQENNCEVYLFTYKNDLYRNSYPDITFIDDMEDVKGMDFDDKFRIGWFDNTPDWVKNQEEQRAGSYYLGLDHKELKPKIDIKNKDKVIEGKYVCISVQSTSQCKYWNNPDGWDKVIEYLNSKGYKVVCIDRHETYGGRDKYNKVPSGAINKTGDFDLQERITDLHNCEFFIGLGSGLSWLAWGVGKDVVLISGFSNEQTEFYTPYRVINKSVCNSCWNRHKFDPSNWNWCPDHEGTEREFECSKQITFEMVKEQIDKLI